MCCGYTWKNLLRLSKFIYSSLLCFNELINRCEAADKPCGWIVFVRLRCSVLMMPVNLHHISVFYTSNWRLTEKNWHPVVWCMVSSEATNKVQLWFKFFLSCWRGSCLQTFWMMGLQFTCVLSIEDLIKLQKLSFHFNRYWTSLESSRCAKILFKFCLYRKFRF